MKRKAKKAGLEIPEANGSQQKTSKMSRKRMQAQDPTRNEEMFRRFAAFVRDTDTNTS